MKAGSRVPFHNRELSRAYTRHDQINNATRKFKKVNVSIKNFQKTLLSISPYRSWKPNSLYWNFWSKEGIALCSSPWRKTILFHNGFSCVHFATWMRLEICWSFSSKFLTLESFLIVRLQGMGFERGCSDIVIILSRHGYFGQINVLGLADTGEQVIMRNLCKYVFMWSWVDGYRLCFHLEFGT